MTLFYVKMGGKYSTAYCSKSYVLLSACEYICQYILEEIAENILNGQAVKGQSSHCRF